MTRLRDGIVRSWEGPNGRRMVLTGKHRLLMRYSGQKRYTVLRHHCTEEEAARLASLEQLIPGGMRI
jgi:hypothetical protein